MEIVTLIFQRERDTKNMTRYEEQPRPGEPIVVRTLYVSKYWAQGADRLTVTIAKISTESGDAA